MIKSLLLILNVYLNKHRHLNFPKDGCLLSQKEREKRDGKIELPEVTGMIQFRSRNKFVKF